VDHLLDRVSEALLVAGPAWAFLFAFLETAWISGLVVPTGPVVIFSAALATGAGLPVWPIWLATFLGGALGDSTHYWIGRRAGETRPDLRGPVGRSLRRHEPRARAMFEKRPTVAVALARLVSFVRTLTPRIAGMTRLPYRRFLFFDVIGLLGWSVLYVGIGAFAGDRWRSVSSAVGVLLIILFLSVVAATWKQVRTRKVRGQASPEVDEGATA
jgi:membrane-associated protein